MADEAAEITEQVTAPEPVAVDSLEAFLAEIGEPVASATKPPAEVVDDDDADDAEDVTDSEVAETEDEPEVVEGPSAEMKQIAKLSGVPEKFIALALNNEQLQGMIEAAEEFRAPTDEPDPKGDTPKSSFEELKLDLELPEDEYPPDDPIRKALQTLKDKFVEEANTTRKLSKALVRFANEQLEEKEQRQLAQQAEQLARVQKPFDAALDAYEHKSLGKTDLITKSKGKGFEQAIQLRSMIFEKVQALGATASTPPEEITRLTDLAVAAVRRDLYDQRNKSQREARKQSRNVLGGRSGSTGVDKPQGFLELLQDVQDGKRSLADV